jgi:glycosyltransferase involved in cell wall biosynthesis
VHGNHLGSEFKLLKGIKKFIFRCLISMFDKGIVLSKSLVSNLTPFLSKELIFILPNFAEEKLYAEDVEVSSKELRIIYISNLMSEKGIFFLLDSLLELKKQNIPYRARIAGDIDKKFEKDILRRLKELPNVTYLNIVKGLEKKKVLDWGNIFILPTFYKMEGQPISILEAMASKNLIITTEHAGIPDIIKNGVNGFFVAKKSSTSITKRLLHLSENKDVITNIANRNKTYFLSNFSVDKFKDRFLKILSFKI